MPRDLETITLKCLRKDPGKRYASAGGLADDLRAFLDGRPIQARPPGPIERARRWLAAKRIGPVPAALLVLLVFVFGLVLSWQFDSTETAQVSIAVDEGGQVELPLVGEVLHPRRDEPLAPPFSVPTVSPDDPRGLVPLPWMRYRLTRPYQDDLFVGQWLSIMVLVLIPTVIVAAAGAKWSGARNRERLLARGVSEEEIRGRRRRHWQLFGLLAGLAVLVPCVVGAVWLALDAGNLGPGERWYWRRWYVFAVYASAVCFTLLAMLAGLGYLARRLFPRRRP